MRAMSAAHLARKGMPLSAECKARLSSAFKGRTFSDAWRQKISEAKAGIDTLTPEQHRLSAEKRRGRKHTEAARVKIVAALHGRPVSQETRKKIGESQPRKLSDEQVLAIRNACVDGIPHVELANKYHVTAVLISRIALGKARLLAGGPISSKRTNPNMYRRSKT